MLVFNVQQGKIIENNLRIPVFHCVPILERYSMYPIFNFLKIFKKLLRGLSFLWRYYFPILALMILPLLLLSRVTHTFERALNLAEYRRVFYC
jgi:hypothetical protein